MGAVVGAGRGSSKRSTKKEGACSRDHLATKRREIWSGGVGRLMGRK